MALSPVETAQFETGSLWSSMWPSIFAWHSLLMPPRGHCARMVTPQRECACSELYSCPGFPCIFSLSHTPSAACTPPLSAPCFLALWLLCSIPFTPPTVASSHCSSGGGMSRGGVDVMLLHLEPEGRLPGPLGMAHAPEEQPERLSSQEAHRGTQPQCCS